MNGIDLPTMAKEMGMSASGWSRVESGDTTMTVAKLRRAAKALRIEPWVLVQQADIIVASSRDDTRSELTMSQGPQPKTGRPRNVDVADTDMVEQRAILTRVVALFGGNRAVGRRLGCSEATVRRYREGRGMPVHLVERARTLLAKPGVRG